MNRLFQKIKTLLVCFIFFTTIVSFAQTNPVAQTMPYTQDFGSNWFKLFSLPAGFALWTATGAPRISNSSAAVSTANGDETTFDSATVVKSPGKAYGYSGIGTGGTAINNGELYVQTSSASTGTDQIVLAISSTGYSSLTVSFDVEMINPQPKKTGFAFQYRVGNTGSFTTVDSSYYHSSSDRSQNQVDYFVNLPLPIPAENQSVIQLRWAFSRDPLPSGAGSCGLGIDNIIVSGIQMSGPLYFRSASSGNWNSLSTWESSADSTNWISATRIPSSAENSIVILNPHTVKTTGISNLVIDEVTVDSGATLWNAYGTLMGLNDGKGSVDLEVKGSFIDSSNNSIVWANTSRWRIGDNGNYVKTTNTSSLNWQLKYYNGIVNIPSTSNWYCRKPAGATTEPSISTTNGGPPYPQVYYGNLYIENNSTSWNSNNLCKFSGSANFPVVKGNFYVGGDGADALNFVNSNTHASPLKVIGDVNIQSGSTLTVTGTGVEVQGDFICKGTYTYSSSLSKLLFSGNNLQNISGTGNISTYKLEIQKPSSLVYVKRNVNVFGNLNMLQGNFNILSAKIIVQNDATVSNASDASYVDGQIQKVGDDPFIFPVGKDGNYQPIAMNAGTGTTITDAFTAEYFNANPQNVYGINYAQGIDHISQCEYWILSKDVGSSLKKVTLTWDAASCGVTNFADLKVARFNNVQWISEGNSSTTGGAGSGTITSDVTTGFGPFTLASVTTENPLPVSLLSFAANYNGKNVLLEWTTASEINNDHFEIEKSTDGITFEKICSVAGAGSSTQLLNYSAEDENPFSGISYYRLRQIDFDGAFSLSGIAPLKIKGDNSVISNLNSSRENALLSFDITYRYPAQAKAEIGDQSGKIILATSIAVSGQKRNIVIDPGGMTRGIYFLRIFCGDEVFVKQFVY